MAKPNAGKVQAFATSACPFPLASWLSRGFSPAFSPSLFNDGKDPGYFALQSGEFRSQDHSPGVQDHVDIARQQGQVQPHRFAHAPLDAVAVDRFAQNAAGGQTHTRTNAGRPLSKKVCHRRREVFAAPLINALIVCVLA
jgi:hypothetical protein